MDYKWDMLYLILLCTLMDEDTSPCAFGLPWRCSSSYWGTSKLDFSRL